MTAAIGPRYDWTRLTYPRGRDDGGYADEHGWLVPLPAWHFPGRRSFLAPLAGVRDEPVIVLMSAGGTGKSTALAQEYQALAGTACLIDLKDLAGKPDPAAWLSAQAAVPSPLPGDCWHVLLDGFDEALSLIPVPGLVALLDAWLGQQPDRGRLRLRLATRPGVRQNAELEQVLLRYWPRDAVVVRDVAPLGRADVLLAATARGVPDPEGFVAGLEKRSLVPVAALPMTSKVLLDRAAEGRPLPESAEEAYRLACEQLCEEPQPWRQRPPGLGLQELMRCAAHLAAILEFCGGGILTTSLEPIAGAPVRLVDAADVIRPEAGAVAEEALSWLTATPLLRSLSDNQWQFASQALQGFLAATHLKGRRLAPVTVQSLLFAGVGRERYVHPRHKDLAGWLAWYRPEVYKEILALDPVPLLSPDLPAQPPAVRAQIADALLTHAARIRRLPRGQDLHRVNHPGLRGQLAEKITPKTAWQPGDSLREVQLATAILLARACPDQAPAGALLDVAEDDETPTGIRTAALEAVPPGAATAPQAASRLDALAAAPEAEVAVGALLALWPQQLPTEALLPRVPTSAPETAWQRIALRLGPADAGAVLAWLQAQFMGGTVNSPAGVMRLLAWACSALRPAEGEKPQQPAAAELADVLVLLLRSDRAHDVHLADIAGSWAGVPVWRRLLAGEIIARLTAADTTALDAVQQHQLALFPPEDSIYWARKAAADTASSLAAMLPLPYPGDIPELDQLRQERASNPQLEAVTARWFAPPPAWLQEARQQAAERSSQINGELERLAAERPAPDEIRPWWGTLVQWLARDPEKFHERHVPVHLDLAAAPSCPPPGSPLRTALQAAALHAVRQTPVMTAAGISRVVGFADACEVTALSLLDTPADLTPERWAGLALVLAFANCDATDHDQRVLLLLLAAGRAGTAFAEVLPAALSAISPQWTANVAATLAETALGDQADQALLAWVTSPDRPVKVWSDTTQALAPHDRATLPVLASLALIADRSLPPDDGDSRARWAHAVDLMLLHGPLDEIPARWHQILDSADSTVAWAQASTEDIGFSLYAHSPVNFWPTAYLMLIPQQAGQLYTRLAACGRVDFPPRRSPLDFPAPRPVADISGPGRRGIHNRLPELIAAHLTDAATQELQRLAATHPGHPELMKLAADHARRVSENLRPPTLAELTTLTTDVTTRVVRDITELTMVVLEALDVLQEQAKRSHGWSMLLWNRETEEAKEGWWPAWEDTLSNLVCAFLREHLAGHKLVINREVEIWPSRIDGSRTDVHVQAADPKDGAAEPLTVVIEVKGCWNRDILTGVTGQLLPYLQPGWAGIFLVGYFHSPEHEHPKYKGFPKEGAKPAKQGRHRTSKKHTPGQVLSDLQQQAGTAPATLIYARVLQLPLVLPSASGAEAA